MCHVLLKQRETHLIFGQRCHIAVHLSPQNEAIVQLCTVQLHLSLTRYINNQKGDEKKVEVTFIALILYWKKDNWRPPSNIFLLF